MLIAMQKPDATLVVGFKEYTLLNKRRYDNAGCYECK